MVQDLRDPIRPGFSAGTLVCVEAQHYIPGDCSGAYSDDTGCVSWILISTGVGKERQAVSRPMEGPAMGRSSFR